MHATLLKEKNILTRMKAPILRGIHWLIMKAMTVVIEMMQYSGKLVVGDIAQPNCLKNQVHHLQYN
jgi:hypothetical protein